MKAIALKTTQQIWFDMQYYTAICNKNQANALKNAKIENYVSIIKKNVLVKYMNLMRTKQGRIDIADINTKCAGCGFLARAPSFDLLTYHCHQ